MSFFPYDEAIRSRLYQFKGCFDYELGDIFFSRALPFLKVYLKDYILIPAPSFAEKDETRGFNHVEKMFAGLGLKIEKAIVKTEDIKQADLSASQRAGIFERLAWVPGVNIRGKKVAFVDDVYTTGSTAKACLRLILEHHPKKTKAVVLAKTTWKRPASSIAYHLPKW